MATDSTFVTWVLEQVRDGELDVETAAAMLSLHLDQCIDEALDDAEHERRTRALEARLRRLEARTRG